MEPKIGETNQLVRRIFAINAADSRLKIEFQFKKKNLECWIFYSFTWRKLRERYFKVNPRLDVNYLMLLKYKSTYIAYII